MGQDDELTPQRRQLEARQPLNNQKPNQVQKDMMFPKPRKAKINAVESIERLALMEDTDHLNNFQSREDKKAIWKKQKG